MEPKEMLVEFVVAGQPVAKGRPRFARRGNHVRAYTPEKTANYETLVKWTAAQAMAGREPSGAPLMLTVAIVLQVPESWSNKRRALALAGEICATKKPDADNVLKGIKDGCNGIVWRDDSQVVALMIGKAYGEVPHVAVTVCEAKGEAA